MNHGSSSEKFYRPHSNISLISLQIQIDMFPKKPVIINGLNSPWKNKDNQLLWAFLAGIQLFFFFRLRSKTVNLTFFFFFHVFSNFAFFMGLTTFKKSTIARYENSPINILVFRFFRFFPVLPVSGFSNFS